MRTYCILILYIIQILSSVEISLHTCKYLKEKYYIIFFLFFIIVFIDISIKVLLVQSTKKTYAHIW